ncbi:Zf-rvt domain-containing protein, partial [Thalictrum thalictroides]
QGDIKKHHRVSWQKICIPKNEGGLGVKNLETWNFAAVMKLTFRIAEGSQSQWSQWVQHNLINDQHFWTMQIPKDCSLAWQGIQKVRSRAVEFIEYNVNERNYSFWYDPWSSHGILREKFSSDVRHVSSIRDNKRLKSFIHHRKWLPPPQMSPEMRILWDSLFDKDIGPHTRKDKLIWKPHPRGIFTIKTAYAVLRLRVPEKPWEKIIWGNHIIPRHSFLLWQAVQDALPTQDKLVEWGKLNISNCALCSQGLTVIDQNQSPAIYNTIPRPKAWTQWYPVICSEQLHSYLTRPDSPSFINWRALHAATSRPPTIEHIFHLFFSCPVSSVLWENVMSWCGLSKINTSLHMEWIWIFHYFKGNSLQKLLSQAALAATIYWIWAERNETMAAAQLLGKPDLIRKNNVMGLRWKPHEEGWFILNADSSLTDDQAGYEGIIRGSRGNVNMAYYASSNTRSILYLELMGIAKGVQLALELGMKKLLIHSDSVQAIRTLLRNASNVENMLTDRKHS